jgi:segregation and condensation protein B
MTSGDNSSDPSLDAVMDRQSDPKDSTASDAGEEMPEEVSDDELKSYVESALFVSSEPMSAADLSNYLDLDGNRIRGLMEELKEEYDRSDRGFQLLKVAGGFKMTTRSKHYPMLKKLFGERTLTRLSDPAIETLVIVAYHQPVTRSEAEAIRGVDCQSVLQTLLEKDFIRISGRRDEIGRPIEYSTTDRFLDYFGLNSLNELPDENEIQTLFGE